MGAKILGVTTFVVVVLIAAAAVFQTAEAETHIVTWSDTAGADYYTSWAANHTFKVDDVLVFDFTTGRHDVAELSKDAYEKCNVSGFISTPKSEGPANYTLSATSSHYFICLFPGHCDQGQKLTIAVTTGSAPTPAPAPSTTSAPAPSTTSAPAPSSTSTPPSESDSPSPSDSESPSPSEADSPSSTSPPPSTPSTPSTTAPPPLGSTGSSSHVRTISTVFMSIAIALFCLF